MDTIREWISDNLRYILLGAALIVVIILAVVGVRAINKLGSNKKTTPVETELETTANTDVIVDSNSGGSNAPGGLVQNDPQVLTIMTSYYAAKTNKDLETLKKLEPSVSEEEQQANLDKNYYIESYSNIKTYSKKGSEEGSCVVYVCYDGKVKDINTLVPSLTQFYLKTDAEGNYYIADVAGDAQAESFIDETRKSSEVQTLIDSVNSQCEAAKNSDPVLKEFMNEHGNSQEGEQETEEETNAEEAAEMVANDICNVRTEPSSDSDDTVIGGLSIGDTVTKTGETDNGWSEIEYNGQKAYVKSEFLSTPDEYQAADEADYFSPEYNNGEDASQDTAQQ